MNGVSVSTDQFAGVLGSVDSIYNTINSISAKIVNFDSEFGCMWQGEEYQAISAQLQDVKKDIEEFQKTYERFGNSLRVLGSNYNSLESEIASSMH